MESILIYLEKFKSYGLEEKKLKETILDILKTNYEIDLDSADLVVKDGEIIINSSGAEKSEIFMNKEQIKKDIKDRLDKDFRSIR